MPVAPPDRNRPAKRRRRRTPSPVQRAKAQQQQYVSQGTAVKRAASQQRRQAKPRPSGPSFAEPFRKPHGLEREQAKARDRVRRAEKRLPDHPGIPHIPVKARGYTPRERRAIQATYRRAAKRQGLTVQQLYSLGSPAQRRQIRQVSRIVMFGPQNARDLRPLRARNRLDRVAPAGRSGVSRALASVVGASSLGGASPENQFVKNIGGDIKALGTAPFIGGYETLASAVEAAHGDLSRARKLASGVAEGLKESVPGQLIQGDTEGALEAFREHPLLSALDVSAAGAVVGRTGGALARGLGRKGAGGVRGRLADLGSTERAPLLINDDLGNPLLVERRHSKDLTRKGGEEARDSGRDRVVLPDGRVAHRANEVERQSHLRREADNAASRANSVERLARDEAAKEMRVRGIKGRRAKDLIAMVVEGTITSSKHFFDDLRTERSRLREMLSHERGHVAQTGKLDRLRDSRELRALEDRLKLVDEVLENPKALAQREGIVNAGVAIGRRLNEREREAVKLGILDPTRAARSRLVPTIVSHMGGRHYAPEELRDLARKGEDISEEALRHGSIRHADGKFMSNAEVEDFLRERGRDPDTVAYLPHRLDTRGARAFHTQFRPGSRSSLDKQEGRTGEAYRKGVTESSLDLAAEQNARLATHVEKAKQLDRTIKDVGVKRDDGSYFTAAQAMEAAKRLENDTGRKYVPVRAYSAKVSPQTRQLIEALQAQGPDSEAAKLIGGLKSLSQKLLNDRIVTEADPKGATRAKNVVLMPEEYISRLNDHLKPAGEIERFLQLMNRPFRYAVLPLSPKWLIGNFVEPYVIRLTGVGSGVNVFGLGMDIARARKALEKMRKSDDPKVRQAAREIDAQYRGGLFIGGGHNRAVRRTGEDVKGLAWLTMARNLPVMKQGVDLLRIIPDASFALNRVLERAAQDATLGRQIRRDVQDLTGSWMQTVKLQSAAIDEVMRGAVKTSTQRRWIRSMHELLGKYEGYSPVMRRLIQSFAPFLPWALNAARFVYWTMPAHRTIQTALLVKVNDVVAQDWADQHRNLPPGGLRLAVPTKDGGWLDLSRYTPYGFSGPVSESVEENPKQALDPVFDLFLPQFSGAVAAARGKDPFGRDLKLDPSENAGESDPTFLQQLAAAAYAQGESTIPYLAQARRLREGGGTAYGGSTIFDPDVKPGTSRVSGVRRVFDPTVPTYLGPKPSKASGPAARSRQDQLLERRAKLLERSASRSNRTDELLERRAKLLRGR